MLNKTRPSPLVIIFSLSPLKNLSNISAISMKVARIENRKSLVIICLFAFSPFTIALIPRTASRLKIFDPMMLLNAISFEPLVDAIMLTTASGALVPNATTVSPIIRVGIFNALARLELPSTK